MANKIYMNTPMLLFMLSLVALLAGASGEVIGRDVAGKGLLVVGTTTVDGFDVIGAEREGDETGIGLNVDGDSVGC